MSRLQSEQYQFPYHHITHADGGGVPRIHRLLRWGLEYECYQRHVLELVKAMSPASVLDVGCGDGRFLGGLLGLVPRLAGVDLTQQAISFASAFYPGIDFQCVEAGALSELFDVVVAIEVMEHVPDAEVGLFVRGLAERAKIGGHVVICVPTTNVPVNRKHFRHYDRQALVEAVLASGVALREVSVEFVFRRDWVLHLYRRMTDNRLWFLDVPKVRELVWRRIWSRLRVCTPDSGEHVVAVFARE